MGNMVSLACPRCGLDSGILNIGWGYSAECHGVAWCPRCQRFTTPVVARRVRSTQSKGASRIATKCKTVSLLDDRGKTRCSNCGQDVPVFDMENKFCPLCGTKMEESIVGYWD